MDLSNFEMLFEKLASIPGAILSFWFDEPVVEMCLRSDRYDQELTLLQFESLGPKVQYEDPV
jgi:hypothetical protein